jgi:hypothetical protein
VLAGHGDSVTVAWSQTTAAVHQAGLETHAGMRDPKAAVPLPRVGQSEILLAVGQ